MDKITINKNYKNVNKLFQQIYTFYVTYSTL